MLKIERVERPRVTHAKLGLFGHDGSGKTRMGSELMCLALRRAGCTRGVLFVDTEGGSEFVSSIFAAADLPLYVVKTRAFAEVLDALDWAVGNVDGVMIDSTTHIHRELLAAYLTRRGRTTMDKSDWSAVRTEWSALTERVVAQPLHFVLCGRLGGVYADYFDEERDRWDSARVGTKMAGDSELGYEPHCTIELKLEERADGGTDVVAHVKKDRWPDSPINGRRFRFPVEADPATVAPRVEEVFGAHFDRYTFGEPARAVDVSSSSASLIASPDRSRIEYRRRQTVEVEEIENTFARYLPGQTANEKRLRAELKTIVFGTGSDTKIAELPPDLLTRCRRVLTAMLAHLAVAPDAAKDLATLKSQVLDDPDRFDVPVAPDREPAAAAVGDF